MAKRDEPELPKGFNCETCGKFHKFNSYVFAHWRTILDHKCDCGARHSIVCGGASQWRRGKKPADEAKEGV